MPTHYDGSPEERLALNTFIKLTRAVDALERRLVHRNIEDGLTPTQFGVMETLYHLGSMCQSELGAKLLRSSGNITLVIDNLEKRDLVRRSRDPNDRRMIQILLTDKGRELIKTVLPLRVAAIVDEISVLEPDEQEELGNLCRKLGKVPV